MLKSSPCPNCHEAIYEGAFHIKITDGKCENRILKQGESIAENMASVNGGVVYIGNSRLRDLMSAVQKEILDQVLVHEDLKLNVHPALRNDSILLNVNVSTMNFCSMLMMETIEAQAKMIEQATKK